MNKIVTLLLLASYSVYGMEEPSLNNATEKYVQICATKLHALNPNRSQGCFAIILTKIVPKNTGILRSNALSFFQSMATELDQYTGPAYHSVNRYAFGRTFQELSPEERTELRQQ